LLREVGSLRRRRSRAARPGGLSLDHLRRGVGAAVWEAKTIVAEHPSIAVPLTRIRGHGEVVEKSTDIVMEAFVRSGLSFAVAAFRLAQEPRAMRIAHHTHSPSTLIDGIRHGVPSLLIVRNPKDAAMSYVIKTPDASIGGTLRGYVRFHRPLLDRRSELVIGTFEQVTGDLGSVIRRLNDRSGTSFGTFHHTEANVSRVFREIEDDWRSRGRNLDERERGVPRPSLSRGLLKERLADAYNGPEARHARERAERIYGTFAALALS
jgi:hypothetical protein